MKLSRVAAWTSGELVGRDLECLGVSTDTRTLEEGNLFVALRGDRFDGHAYLHDAARAGAAGALVEQDTDAFPGYVRVPDTRRALGRLAAGWAAQFPLQAVAVTGSAGKTTVKEMLALMLGPGVLATRGNLNNEIGVPLTLLRAESVHRHAVIELGANHPGEIAWTSTLVQPRVVMVTNVGGAHLEGFGSMQGIAEAKSEILRGLRAGGTAIVNLDDDFAGFFIERAREAGAQVVRVSVHEPAEITAEDIVVDEAGTRFVCRSGEQRWPVSIPLLGEHQVRNALMALAAVQALGLAPGPAAERLAGLEAVPGRMEPHACDGGVLIDDSYNASPVSVRAGIEVLARLPGPRLLALGAMGELGAHGAALHRDAGAWAKAAGIDRLVVLGEDAAPAVEAFGEDGVLASRHEEIIEAARAILRAGGSVLVKGSRAMAMDRVVMALRGAEEEG